MHSGKKCASDDSATTSTTVLIIWKLCLNARPGISPSSHQISLHSCILSLLPPKQPLHFDSLRPIRLHEQESKLALIHPMNIQILPSPLSTTMSVSHALSQLRRNQVFSSFPPISTSLSASFCSFETEAGSSPSHNSNTMYAKMANCLALFASLFFAMRRQS